MGEDNNQNSQGLHSEPVKGRRGESPDEKMANNWDKEERVSSESRSGCAVGNSSRNESKASELETLTSVQLSQAALADFDESSHRLSEVPVEYSLQPIQSDEKLKEQSKAVHDKSLESVTGVASEVQRSVPNDPSVSPESFAKSVSSIPNLFLVKDGNKTSISEGDKQNSPGSKPLPIRTVLKTSDGYNWRKYGQKQVKSPEGSRSYYRCTFSDCYAKKIEFCDPSNHLIETVYRSHHNHDSLQKVDCTKESLPALPSVPFSGDNDSFRPVVSSNDPVKDNMLKQSIPRPSEMRETRKQESNDSVETTEVNMEEYVDGAECRKRQKRKSSDDLESMPKPGSGRKPKYVVHAAGDVGISGDGYRWRKYGQKMVKGNPHPRNYYRCTSAGCPVRKHIEGAVDNTNAVVITYKGVHDHDTPVPRKRDGPKSSVVADSPIIPDNMLYKGNQSHNGQTKWSVDKGDELMGEPLKVVGEKASEPARTLVGIGIQIKPC
ncbi:Probable WRKY transcription factor 32 [Striga hermonthica]|uniref:Probable WRKY transcription factor 32 n=1 Tax=Striga hermonthica TaxID=68872 RepID=A0A9N7N0X7_STRHE|nr:Probable WRKY transcription factor 32 [Striga hermonthica]